MDAHPARSDHLGRSAAVISAIGRSVSALLAEMHHEIERMAADLAQPSTSSWRAHRPAIDRTRRPGFGPR